MAHFEERRRHQRIANNIPLKISSDEADLVTETFNISRAGIYCRVNKYLLPMTKLRVQLLLPFKKNNRTVTKKISCQGVVVRIEPEGGQPPFKTAIYFTDIHPKEANVLTDYVQDQIDKDKKRMAV